MAGTKSFSTAAATTIGGNDDLLIQILVLSPAKSVTRFKSVCKQWLSLISGEEFPDLHIRSHWRRKAETQHSFILADSYGRQVFLCHPTSRKLVRVSLPRPVRYLPPRDHMKKRYLEYFRKDKEVKVLQSVNGLLLLSMKFYSREEERVGFREDGLKLIDYFVVVFNPTTKQYRFIDLDGYTPYGYTSRKICLIFDPSISRYYKLAMTTTAHTRLSVYDSATHKWTHGTECPEFWSTPDDRTGWILDHTTGGTGWSSYPPRAREIFHVGMSKEEDEENKCCFRVSMMTEDRREIRKEATLDFEGGVGFLGMIEEERIEDTTFLLHVPGRLLTYRFSDGDRRDHDDVEVVVDYRDDYFYEEDQLQFQYARPFVHTFAPV